MSIRQREIIEVNFRLPGGALKPHPVIVLSNNQINEYEDAFVCIMLSGSNIDDNYSFHLENNMLTKIPKKNVR